MTRAIHLHLHLHDHAPRHAAPDEDTHEPDQQWLVDVLDAISQQIHDTERRVIMATQAEQDQLNTAVQRLNALIQRVEAKLTPETPLDVSGLNSALDAADAAFPADQPVA